MVSDAPTRHAKFMFQVPDGWVTQALSRNRVDHTEGASVLATPARVPEPEQPEEPTVDSLGAVTATIQHDLLEIEARLREVWQDAAPLAPGLAARLTVAARLIHNAAAALSLDSLI